MSKHTAEQMFQKAQAKADRLFEGIEKRLVKASVPVKEVKEIMRMIAEYGNAEIDAESYCENGVDVEVNR